jgi:hypothetical protein
VGAVANDIRASVEAFQSDSWQQGKRLRVLLESEPAAFRLVAQSLLQEARETPEVRYVIALLASRGMLLALLRDLAHSDLGAAGLVAQMAQRMDPSFEGVLARAAVNPSPDLQQSEVDPAFLLGLLESLNSGFNLLPLLGRLRHHGDPRVRAKLAGFLGKAIRPLEWFRDLTSDPDARVRANAVEALWGQDSDYARQAFAHACSDTHQRVAANALVGQFLLGMAESVAGLAGMARHEDPNFRAAAAWAMGRTGDGRFIPLLSALRRDPGRNARIIRNALQSLGRIEQAERTALRGPAVVNFLSLHVSATGSITARVFASGADGTPVSGLRPASWRILANGQPVWRYQALHHVAPERLAVGYLFPLSSRLEEGRLAQWRRALTRAVEKKRAADCLAVAFYSEEPHTGAVTRTGEILGLRSDPTEDQGAPSGAPAHGFDVARVLRAAAEPPSWLDAAAGPAAALPALASAIETAGASNDLVLVLDRLDESLSHRAGFDSLRQRIEHGRHRLHLVMTDAASGPSAGQWRALAHQTGGAVCRIRGWEGAAGALEIVASGLLAHTELRFDAPVPVESLEFVLRSGRHEASLVLSGSDALAASGLAA